MKIASVMIARAKDNGATVAAITGILYGPLVVHPEITEWTDNCPPVLRTAFPRNEQSNWTVTHAESGCIVVTASRKKLACAMASKLAMAINWTGLRKGDKARIESIRPTRNAIRDEVNSKG